MRIRAIIHSSLYSSVSECVVEVDDEISIEELIGIEELHCGFSDLSEYYPLSGKFSFNNFYLPFIITDHRIKYDVPFSEAKLTDFLQTHNVNDGSIHILTDLVQAGGPGYLSLTEIWNSTVTILESIAMLMTISGYSLRTFVDWFCSIFKKRKVKPQTIMDIIYSRTCWNHYELAELMEIESDRARDMLKVFGFEYDKSRMQYVQSENIEEIKKKLTAIPAYQI